jgi:tRNA-dihydrouridine synthase A
VWPELIYPVAPKEFSVAPMMDWTDRHCRYFLRLISPSIQLYTEMVTAQAIKYGDRDHLLGFDAKERFLALQLGGSDPVMLAESARIGEAYGYDEINLNVGCPSPRVSSGRFGACLMHEPKLVADCVTAMREAVSIPVTVKCRIGVDERDSYDELVRFIEIISKAGCQKLIVHARKAWLSGLSPKENREIPPLRYDVVRQLKADFPQLKIILNGGLKTLAGIEAELGAVDGVMIGRAAYHDPWLLHVISANLLQENELLDRSGVVRVMIAYAREQIKKGVRLHSITRHMLGLYQGQRGAAMWRRHLSTEAPKRPADVNVIEEALAMVEYASMNINMVTSSNIDMKSAIVMPAKAGIQSL